MAPRVFTIPASAPFLRTLIEALIGGKLGFAAAGDPLALAAATLYLPTRRACRLARDAFLDVLKDDAAILPRIVAIGDIDEDEIAFGEAATGTDAPVIAAGSTGSIPATAELIATIARLPTAPWCCRGSIPISTTSCGSSIAGDESKRIAPAPGHPQFAMQALLTRIGITRDAVASLAAPRGRERLLSEALRPAAKTDMWRQKAAEPEFEAHVETALETLTVIEAANAEEESLAIAVALREAVHDGKTAALVTPDRALGRRVLAALARWNISAEDFGGDALAETPAGILPGSPPKLRFTALPRSRCWRC